MSLPEIDFSSLDNVKIGRLIAAATGKRINLRVEEIAEFYFLASMVKSYCEVLAYKEVAKISEAAHD